MKAHTSDFKNEIKRFGRQISSKIFHYYTFSLITEDDNSLITENDFNLVTEQFNENDKELIEEENINQITIIQDGQLLKSLMKRVELETTIDIDIKDAIRVNFGILVNENYEYLDYGNYIVYKKTYNASNKSWTYICYDMMLYSMIQYRRLNISYPITIRNYLKAIANKMGINFNNENDEFTNYNQLITNDYFQGKNATLRDILDLLSQVTASVICINNDDELEVRYPSNAGTYETQTGTTIAIENVDDVNDFSYELKGNTVQNGTPTPDSPVSIQTVTGRQTIDVVGKNIFNFNNTFYKRYTNTNVEINGNNITITNNTTGGNTYVWWGIPVKIGEEITISYDNLVSSADADNNRIEYFFYSGIPTTYNSTTFGSSSIVSKETKNATTTATNDYLILILRCRNGVNSYTISNIQVEYGENTTEYEEYTGQSYEIWLDNNLFDKTDYRNNSRINSTGGNYEEDGCFTSRMIKVEPNTTYVKNSPIEDGYHRVAFYTGTTTSTFISKTENNTFTTPATCEYLRFCGYKTELDTAQLLKQNQERRIIELCKVGDYQDKIYKQDGKWYLYKEIGKVVLDGTETWANVNTTTNNRTYRTSKVVTKGTEDINDLISNYFERKLGVWSLNDGTSGVGRVTDTGYLIFSMPRATIANTTAFREWLGTHNTIVYYILETSTTTEITDIELINQLETIRLQQGTNNITVDSNSLSSPLKLTYLSELETIDEEMLKDVNVSFGEKYGPINKITLIDSENKIEYTSQDDISIQKNNLIEIKINDNPIVLNGDIETVGNNILKRLSGIYYSINDFNSTGICYFDYLDIFKVKIEGNDYKCLLLNDEIEITQGLQETIYSEALENSNIENDNYKTTNLSNKEVQQKIVKLNDNKVDNKSVVNSINNSKETTVVDTNKIMNRKTISGVTNSDGFLDIQLDSRYIIINATAQFSSNDYGFIIPYYYYNNGSPKWLLKIENKNKTSLANTEITVIVYYAKIKEEYEWQI